MTETSPSKLARVLQAGQFAITAETSPPDSSSPQSVLDRVACLKGLADAVNVTDGASAERYCQALALNDKSARRISAERAALAGLTAAWRALAAEGEWT